jgi:uncharacterized protein (TIGR02246 family)
MPSGFSGGVLKTTSFKMFGTGCAVIADNSAAFNRRGPKALAANVTADTDHIGVRGDWVSGKAALEKGLAEYFTSADRPTTEDDVQQIRFIAPDVAVVIVKRLYRRPAETRQSVATYVMQRVDADWRIAAFQNTFIQ